MNIFVEEKTNSKIKDLLSTDNINDDTRLLLINAVYFKGLWLKNFNPKRTLMKSFYISETKQNQVVYSFFYKCIFNEYMITEAYAI